MTSSAPMGESGTDRRTFLVAAASSLAVALTAGCTADAVEPVDGAAEPAVEAGVGRSPRPGQPLWTLSAVELVRHLRSGEVSSREVVEAHLARIESVNPRANAVTLELEESALADADAADRRWARAGRAGRDDLGALHGLPFTVKENIDLVGSATTQGLRAFSEMDPPLDSPYIAQLKAAGAIALARTNLPDLATRWHTDNDLHGPTLNPWDPTRTPGGSSGGDAVAVATGMTPIGMGNDYFGSLRVPAHGCGVASLKPSLGRVPQASSALEDFPMSLQIMAVQGPMARHVADLRLSLGAMSGPDPRDPWWTPTPLSGDARPRRVAVQPAGDVAGTVAAVRAAADALADAGYDVVEEEVPRIEEASETALALVASDTVVLADLARPFLGADGRTFIDHFTSLRPPLDREGYGRALTTRQGIARSWATFQQDRPLVLGPVTTRPHARAGDDLTPAAIEDIFGGLRLTVTVNLAGIPSVTVPVNVTDGLPYAVQIIGPAHREDLALDAAEVIEGAARVPTPIDPV